MNALTAARAQMEVSLGFHMVFAALGIGMPLLMLVAEALHLRTGKPHYRELARTWGKATALLFAVGAVSGTALSFELGLLWPRFMRLAGPVVGPAFALEGYAFFIEAVFVGLYLYGWERLSPRAHLLTGIPVAVSGMFSGVIVVAANAWMQHPVGFREFAGLPIDVHPGEVFANPYWFTMALHSTLSCYIATGFAVAGVYAVALLRGRNDVYHRSGLVIAMVIAAASAVAQLPSGHLTAQNVAHRQPLKLAAVEAHFETGRSAAITLAGVPDVAHRTIQYGLRVPYALSLLATDDPHGEVRGLDAAREQDWPNVVLCHFAFDVMVGCGFALLALGAWFFLARWRRREHDSRWLLRAVAVASPLGFIALEAGWVVTEAGRQPWVVYGVMRTRDAVTPAGHIDATFYVFTLLYVALGAALIALLRFLAASRHDTKAAA